MRQQIQSRMQKQEQLQDEISGLHSKISAIQESIKLQKNKNVDISQRIQNNYQVINSQVQNLVPSEQNAVKRNQDYPPQNQQGNLPIGELRDLKSQINSLLLQQNIIYQYASTEVQNQLIYISPQKLNTFKLNETEYKYSEIERNIPQMKLTMVEIIISTFIELIITLFFIQPLFIIWGLFSGFFAVCEGQNKEVIMKSLQKALFSSISTLITVICLYYLFFEENSILRASFFNIFILQIAQITFFSIFKGSKFSIFYYYKYVLPEQYSKNVSTLQNNNQHSRIDSSSLLIKYLKWMSLSIFHSESEILGLNQYQFKDSNYNDDSSASLYDNNNINNAWLLSQDIFFNQSSWQFEIIRSAKEYDILIQLQRFKYYMERDEVKSQQQLLNRKIFELLSITKENHEQLHQVRPTYYLFVFLIIIKSLLFMVFYTILFSFNLEMAALIFLSLVLNIRILYNFSIVLGSQDLRIKSIILDKLNYQITYLENDIKLESKIDISSTMSLVTWNNARKTLLSLYSKQQSIYENCYSFFTLLVIIYSFICYLSIRGDQIIPAIFRDNPIVLIQFLLDIPIFCIFIVERVYYSSQFNSKFKELGTEIQKIKSLVWETLNDLDNYFFNNILTNNYENFADKQYKFANDNSVNVVSSQSLQNQQNETNITYSMNLLLVMKVQYLQRLHIEQGIPYQGKKWNNQPYALQQLMLQSIVNQFNQIHQEQEADILSKQHKILNVTSIEFKTLAMSIVYSAVPILTTLLSYIYPYFKNMFSSHQE